MGRDRKGGGRTPRTREQPADQSQRQVPRGVPLRQSGMFQDREVAQFGTKARPQMSAERTGGGGLVLELRTQDPRTPAEIERARREEEDRQNLRMWGDAPAANSEGPARPDDPAARKKPLKRARAKLIETRREGKDELIRVGISHNYSLVVVGRSGRYTIHEGHIKSASQARESNELAVGKDRASSVKIARSMIDRSHALDQEGAPVYTPEQYEKMRDETEDLRSD